MPGLAPGISVAWPQRWAAGVMLRSYAATPTPKKCRVFLYTTQACGLSLPAIALL